MHLAQVQLHDFRLFGQASLQCSADVNLILGDNGAGKSSLLEALYVLGRAGSPRAASRALVRDGTPSWAVEAALAGNAGEPAQRLRVAWADGETRILWNASSISISELVRALPIQLLDPSLHRLIDEGPGVRRRVLDWGVFHVEQSFIGIWRRYQRALRQRNAALRSGAAAAAVVAWDPELTDTGEALDQLRHEYLRRLEPYFTETLIGLLPEQDWGYRLQRGWPAERHYAEVLRDNLERDRRQAQTLQGPHRAELLFTQSKEQGGRGARGRISRGQQKLLVCAFSLAQCQMVEQAGGPAPILLLDDFNAELAAEFQQRLVASLCRYRGQKFLAALELTPALAGWPGAPAVFHVEHGRVSALVK